MAGVVPKRITKLVYGYKRNGKRRGRPLVTMVWGVSLRAICQARELYQEWHHAVTRVIGELEGRVSGQK
jgi:hypothetical protein